MCLCLASRQSHSLKPLFCSPIFSHVTLRFNFWDLALAQVFSPKSFPDPAGQTGLPLLSYSTVYTLVHAHICSCFGIYGGLKLTLSIFLDRSPIYWGRSEFLACPFQFCGLWETVSVSQRAASPIQLLWEVWRPNSSQQLAPQARHLLSHLHGCLSMQCLHVALLHIAGEWLPSSIHLNILTLGEQTSLIQTR